MIHVHYFKFPWARNVGPKLQGHHKLQCGRWPCLGSSEDSTGEGPPSKPLGCGPLDHRPRSSLVVGWRLWQFLDSPVSAAQQLASSMHMRGGSHRLPAS